MAISSDLAIVNEPVPAKMTTWNQLPYDLIREITSNLSFQDTCSLASICKLWNAAIIAPLYGNMQLADMPLPTESCSWICQYRTFFTSHHVIALDISGSMAWLNASNGQRRRDVAAQLISDICSKLSAPISRIGVDCIAFSSQVFEKKCFSAEDTAWFNFG